MKVRSFRFANTPPCFQRYMDKVFTPLLYKGVKIYLNNILMHHKTESEHIEHQEDMILSKNLTHF